MRKARRTIAAWLLQKARKKTNPQLARARLLQKKARWQKADTGLEVRKMQGYYTTRRDYRTIPDADFVKQAKVKFDESAKKAEEHIAKQKALEQEFKALQRKALTCRQRARKIARFIAGKRK